MAAGLPGCQDEGNTGNSFGFIQLQWPDIQLEKIQPNLIGKL